MSRSTPPVRAACRSRDHWTDSLGTAAKPVIVASSIALSGDEQAALSFYLTKYLDFLQIGNHHVLYDLPDFDGTAKATTDHLVYTSPLDAERFCSGVALHGIGEQEINASLRRKWLNSALVTELPEDPLSICLAELDSSWLPQPSAETIPRFYARFSPPTVLPLCSSEAILRIHISDFASFVAA